MEILFIEKLIRLALDEDIGDGDHSSLCCIPAHEVGEVQLMSKQNGILAGMEIAPMVFQIVDRGIAVKNCIPDGASIAYGDICFTARGAVHSLLRAERVVLNIVQRMSGVATQTRRYVDRIAGTKAKILDTRKTNPGMRVLDKMAVRVGGGLNHRIGLYDKIILKDNHIDFAGGVSNAIKRAKEYLHAGGMKLDIEVEVRSIHDVQEVLRNDGVQRVMLDNFTVEQTREAVKIIGGRFEVESSGGITLDTVLAYAEAGVDFISVGAITHRVESIDMNLKRIGKS